MKLQREWREEVLLKAKGHLWISVLLPSDLITHLLPLPTYFFAKLEQRWWDADTVCMTHLPPEQDVGNWICGVLNCHSLEESVSKEISECVIKWFSQAQEIAVQYGHLFTDLQGLPAIQVLGSSAMQHLGKILLYFNPTNSQNPCSANGRDGVLATECLSQDSNRGFELGSLLSLDIKILPEKMFILFHDFY